VVSHTKVHVDEDYDSQLIVDSHTVLMLVREDLEEGDDLKELHLDFAAPSLNANDRSTLAHYARWRAVRIWKDKKLAALSDSLKDMVFPKLPTGFTEQKIGQDTWRIFTVYVPKSKITVEVWENLSNRQELVSSILTGMAYAGATILPVLFLLLVLSIRHSLRSLRLMAHQLKMRKKEDLSPIILPSVPKELAPLHRAINTLLERISQNMAHERQFMDNVAHELRTPLATLRLQGELIAHAPEESQRQECVADLIRVIDSTTHLFDQVLKFSRLSHQSVEACATDPVPIIQEVISQRIALAISKQIDISLDAHESSQLRTNPELLHIMLGALMDNALKYTCEGGSVHVDVFVSSIVITDSGVGIAPSEYDLVFQRFARGTGTHTVKGSGLGLAIVKEICDMLGVSVTLSKPELHSGLKVTLQF